MDCLRNTMFLIMYVHFIIMTRKHIISMIHITVVYRIKFSDFSEMYQLYIFIVSVSCEEGCTFGYKVQFTLATGGSYNILLIHKISITNIVFLYSFGVHYNFYNLPISIIILEEKCNIHSQTMKKLKFISK